MRKVLLPFILFPLVLSVSSCDFLRSLAGRPTSEQIKSAQTKASAEEVPQEDAVCKESMPQEEVPCESEYKMVKRHGRLNVPFAYTHTNSTLRQTPEYTYYVIVGTYRQKPTLGKMLSDAKAAGYDPVLLEYTNGLVSVGLLPCDELAKAIDAYATVKSEKFCPADACVLIAK